jgi:hypothetical protein
MASNYPRECNGSNANYCFDRAILVLGMAGAGEVWEWARLRSCDFKS